MRTRWSVLIALTFLSAQPAQSLAAPGDLDQTFQGGVVRIGGHEATGLALTPTGEAVVAGTGIVHTRLTLDGRPAAGYERGPVRTLFDRYRYPRAGAVAVQPDGRTVIGGRVDYPTEGSYPANLFLRYLPDGTPDPSFGTDGVVIQDLTPDRTTVEEVLDTAIDASGRVVFLGEVGRAPVIGRLLSDGQMDPSFAGGFVPVANVKGLDLELFAIVVTPDGGVIAVGMHRSRDPVLVRLTANGALDAAFGDGGVARLTVKRDVNSSTLALGPNGTIVVGGTAYGLSDSENRFWALRFTADGHADPSFGGPEGVSVQDPIPSQPDPALLGGGANDIAVQANGKVVVAGGAIVRLLADGSIDRGFGGGDGIVTPVEDQSDFADVALQPDGKIVASQRSGFRIWRLEGDGASGAPHVSPTTPRADPTPTTQPSTPVVPDLTPSLAATATDITTASPAAPANPPTRTSPATAKPTTIAVNRHGVARVPVVCPAKGRCAGVVRVRVNGRVAAQRRFSVRPRVSPWHFAVRLEARTRKLLRRHTQVSARVEVQIRQQRTRQTVTLSG